MVILNTVVGYLVNPLMLGILLLLSGCVLQYAWKRRAAIFANTCAVAWFWVWSTQALYMVLGGRLERQYPPAKADSMPQADAIVVLGGGMGANVKMPYAEMWSGADRVWHAARLYHAGKAPLVIPSGTGEGEATLPLLKDLGVPEEAIRLEIQARNTEENALRVSELLRKLSPADTNKVRTVLLVTSAWHMRRALLNFRQTDLVVIPAATDHEALVNDHPRRLWTDFMPSYDRFSRNCGAFKEVLGYWLYRLKYACLIPEGAKQ